MTSTRTDRVELLQGTLDLIVLRALATMGPQHAYALTARLEQMAEHPFTLNQGTLHPALVRLDKKAGSKAPGRRPKTTGKRSTTASRRPARGRWRNKTERWRRLAGLVEKLLLHES